MQDVLARRTRALFLDARASIEAAPLVAALLAAELGRDEAWKEQQVTEFRALAAGYFSGRQWRLARSRPEALHRIGGDEIEGFVKREDGPAVQADGPPAIGVWAPVEHLVFPWISLGRSRAIGTPVSSRTRV